MDVTLKYLLSLSVMWTAAEFSVITRGSSEEREIRKVSLTSKMMSLIIVILAQEVASSMETGS